MFKEPKKSIFSVEHPSASQKSDFAHLPWPFSVYRIFLLLISLPHSHQRYPEDCQCIKNPPVVQEIWETQVQSLVQEGCLEEKMATHSSILAWRIPWTEKPGGLRSMGSQKSQMQLSD